MQYNLPKVLVVPDCDNCSEYGSNMGHEGYADDDSAEGTEDGMERSQSQYPMRSTASVTMPGRLAAGGSLYPGRSFGSLAGSPTTLGRPPAATTRMAGGGHGGSITGVREREPLGEGDEGRTDSGVYASSKLVMEVSTSLCFDLPLTVLLCHFCYYRNYQTKYSLAAGPRDGQYWHAQPPSSSNRQQGCGRPCRDSD